MAYAEGRVYNDADAHIMETATWTSDYADARTQAILKPLDLSMAGDMVDRLRGDTVDPGHGTRSTSKKT
jgi:hypothetical protein